MLPYNYKRRSECDGFSYLIDTEDGKLSFNLEKTTGDISIEIEEVQLLAWDLPHVVFLKGNLELMVYSFYSDTYYY